MTRTLRSLLLCLPLLALLATFAGGATPETASTPDPVTIAFVRHAETTGAPGDPELSEAGQERAQRLAALLAEADVSHLFSSEFRRTRATLAPLAAARELEVAEVGARDAAALVEKLRALEPGSVAVVAGHSNTVPGLVAALGCEARDCVDDPRHGRMFPHEAYDRLILVTLLADGEPHSIELRY